MAETPQAAHTQIKLNKRMESRTFLAEALIGLSGSAALARRKLKLAWRLRSVYRPAVPLAARMW